MNASPRLSGVPVCKQRAVASRGTRRIAWPDIGRNGFRRLNAHVRSGICGAHYMPFNTLLGALRVHAHGTIAAMTAYKKVGAPNMPRRWTDLASDLMDPTAVLHWRHLLRAAHQTPITDRVDHVRSLPTDRTVLDTAVVRHSFVNGRQQRWPHGTVTAGVKTCFSVDIQANEVDMLQELSYNAKAIDITTEFLGEQFDLVICGDVIARAGNTDVLSTVPREPLRSAGQCVVTTPECICAAPNLPTPAEPSIRECSPCKAYQSLGLVQLAERASPILDAYRVVLYDPAAGRLPTYDALATQHSLHPPEAPYDTLIYEIILTGRPDAST
jgi:hypothetical protein